jgi:hypothetical protein
VARPHQVIFIPVELDPDCIKNTFMNFHERFGASSIPKSTRLECSEPFLPEKIGVPIQNPERQF